MKKRTMILLVAGLLVGALAGIAFAFGGTDEVDVTGDEGMINSDANETPENDANETGAAGDADQVFVDQWDVPDNGHNVKIAYYFSITGAVVSVEDLWRLYHRSINNESRNNPGLQRQFMPSRYRKYLNEFE